MTNFLRMAAVAATAAAAVTAAPAVAAPVGVTSGPKPTANARIIKPLTLTRVRDLDFGTIVMDSVPVGGSAVSVSTASARSCGAGLTCSGTAQSAQYNVRGTNNQVVQVFATNVSLTGSNGGSLTFTPAVPGNVTLTSSGAPGNNFDVGGSITVLPTTIDGVYSGDMEVTVDYL
ncbi:DUF4402 domain-containing protein [Sphingomonas arenae]|uniref:DUF4402 domain-containing protein n=1 Tax=Sphingomonas arenae TaxID=2812555 RepID=UPI001967EF7A|nr:DUF4402 domain-containing protein [Sphingomonas arenae]